MKWVIAILLALNLRAGFYGFGQTFTTLNLLGLSVGVIEGRSYYVGHEAICL